MTISCYGSIKQNILYKGWSGLLFAMYCCRGRRRMNLNVMLAVAFYLFYFASQPGDWLLTYMFILWNLNLKELQQLSWDCLQTINKATYNPKSYYITKSQTVFRYIPNLVPERVKTWKISTDIMSRDVHKERFRVWCCLTEPWIKNAENKTELATKR